MKRVKLTSEWLAAWSPAKQAEVVDGVCRGLLVRAGPSGVKAFYRWAGVRDLATGEVRRKRVRMGPWAIDGGRGALSLGDARALFLEAQAAKRAETDGTAELTVEQLAEAYRRDVLSHRERSAEAWNVLRVHIVEARPDPQRPAFGKWPARAVRPADVAAVVRCAATVRTVPARRKSSPAESSPLTPPPLQASPGDTLQGDSPPAIPKQGVRRGGPGVARVVLREARAIFAHAVETGSLEMTPAGVLKGRSFGLRATSRNRVLDAEEIKALFAALDLTALLEGTATSQRLSPVVRLGVAFQLYVPLRSHSLIGARWEEYDLNARTWTVPVMRLKLKKQERATARPFVVPLPETAIQILRRLRDLGGESPWVLASPLKPKEHIEPKALIRAVSRLFDTGRLALGSRVTIHDLRRTWRAFAMDLGVDHVVAERSLGHTTALRSAGFSGSADVYGRGQMVEQRGQAAELVAAAFDRIRLGNAANVVPLVERR